MLETKFKKEYIKDNDSRYACHYLISFYTKYKRHIFTEENIKDLEKSFLQTSKKYDFEILNSEIEGNKVTLVVSCNPKLGIETLIIKLKKDSSNYLIKKDKSFETRIPCIWTREKFISTVGTVKETELKEFESAQKTYAESVKKG